LNFWEYNDVRGLKVQVAETLEQTLKQTLKQTLSKVRGGLWAYLLPRRLKHRELALTRPRACTWLLALALLLPFSVFSAVAAPAQQQQSYNYSKQGGISVEQAAAMVRRETGGRVLSANPVKSNGQRGYNIRVLIDGKRIKQYYVDDQGRMSPD
jgi:hypothetical protein